MKCGIFYLMETYASGGPGARISPERGCAPPQHVRKLKNEYVIRQTCPSPRRGTSRR